MVSVYVCMCMVRWCIAINLADFVKLCKLKFHRFCAFFRTLFRLLVFFRFNGAMALYRTVSTLYEYKLLFSTLSSDP